MIVHPTKRFKIKYKIVSFGEKHLVRKPDPDKITRIEESALFIYIPVLSEVGKHDSCKTKIRTVSKKEGIQAKCCAVDNKIISYMFDKIKWDKIPALRWVNMQEG